MSMVAARQTVAQQVGSECSDLACGSCSTEGRTCRWQLLSARANDPAVLTQREQQVLALSRAGHTSARVAREFAISRRTVEKHGSSDLSVVTGLRS